EVVPAEGPVVLAGLEDVELGPEEHHREREAVARERLREADDVGRDAGSLEGEEGAGAATADLDVVDDEQDAEVLRELGEAADPGVGSDVHAALRLHRLDD